MTATPRTAGSSRTTSTARGIALSVTVAAVASAVVNTVISLLAQALGADASKIMGLTPPLYIGFAVIGLLIAALAWSAVRAKASNPAAVMRWLVPAVVLISLIPDALVAVGMSAVGGIALGLMHLVVAAAGVAAFRRFLPLDS
jgi:uncharacterized membrane protein (UPF0182 family)